LDQLLHIALIELVGDRLPWLQIEPRLIQTAAQPAGDIAR